MATEGRLRAVEACRVVNTKTVISEDRQFKTCTKCGVMQHKDNFHTLKRGILGVNAWCKHCMSLYKEARKERRTEDDRKRLQVSQRAYYEANKERCLENSRRYRIEAYGISVEKYEEMCQNGCWICGTLEDLHIDHDHNCCEASSKSCGKCVRGILCSWCNRGLGHFMDSKEKLMNAVRYLEGERPC